MNKSHALSTKPTVSYSSPSGKWGITAAAVVVALVIGIFIGMSIGGKSGVTGAATS
ncbi:hypothetical protein HYU13_01330, partial [Candidatus Woesearchaeota archaeon]|nr:hypothetical protein [Candidatus Woesearchaeota archaeon]